MNRKSTRSRTLIGLLTLALALSLTASMGLPSQPAYSQGAQGQAPSGAPYTYSFTYQGELKDPGGPVNNSCDFQFSLWSTISGAQIGPTQEVLNLAVVDGLFTVELSFGENAFTGGGRELEIAVRCPAGSGSYTTLAPRQPLTAAPYALSLQPGAYVLNVSTTGNTYGLGLRSEAGHGLFVDDAALHGIQIDNAGANGINILDAGGSGLRVVQSTSHGLEVNQAGGQGVYVGTAALHGLQIDAATINGVNILQTGGDGLYVERAGAPSTFAWSDDDNGLEVAGAAGHGLWVGQADKMGVIVYRSGSDGMHVETAGVDGFYVGLAGTWPTATVSAENNGVEVAGAQGYGLYVGAAGRSGVKVQEANGHGFDVAHTGGNGVQVYAAEDHGLYVHDAGLHGLQIDTAGYAGVNILQSVLDGVFVEQAGTAPAVTPSAGSNGFEVAGAETYGLYIGSTGASGIRIEDAAANGLYVNAAGNDGVEVHGAGAYAGNFNGDIYVAGACIGCLRGAFGFNAGSRALQPGDIVAIQGVQNTSLDNAPTLWKVVPAGSGGTAVGVVSGRAELELSGSEHAGQRLVPRDGAAQPGEYLVIVTSGPMQVRAETAGGPITAGMRLAVGSGGLARALKTVVVDGVTLSEGAPTIGIALEAPQGGLVWVLVNPQ